MKVRIAFIGCGGIAGAHLSRLSELEDVEFVAFCDPVEEKAANYAKIYGGNVYGDFRIMFEKEKFDACYICVPPFAHEGQEELCIENKIPFFVEKPVHIDLEKGRKIAEKVKESKIITSVGYVLRYLDIVEQAREIIKNEKIAITRGIYYGQVPNTGWLIKKQLSGGQLIEQATHTVDMMRYLVGEVEEVFAYKFEGINNKIYSEYGYDVEDASSVLMKFDNGVIGNLTCTWLWSGYNSSVEIVGKDVIMTHQGNYLTIDRGDKKETFISNLDPMLEEDKAFIKAVRENNPAYIKSDYIDGFKTFEITIKSNYSMNEGRPVKI